jgi:hypothetical protein
MTKKKGPIGQQGLQYEAAVLIFYTDVLAVPLVLFSLKK